jgi:hypothetical protein
MVFYKSSIIGDFIVMNFESSSTATGADATGATGLQAKACWKEFERAFAEHMWYLNFLQSCSDGDFYIIHFQFNFCNSNLLQI